MRREMAKATSDAAYIVWLEERLSFLRILVCVLLAVAVLAAVVLWKVVPDRKKPATSTPTYYSYHTPRPTAEVRPGENPLEKYLPKNQDQE